METSQIRHTRKRLADDSFTKNYHLKRGLTSAATTISVDPPKNPVIEAKNAVKANYSAATRLRIQQLRNSRMSGVVSSAVKSPPVNDKENDGFAIPPAHKTTALSSTAPSSTNPTVTTVNPIKERRVLQDKQPLIKPNNAHNKPITNSFVKPSSTLTQSINENQALLKKVVVKSNIIKNPVDTTVLRNISGSKVVAVDKYSYHYKNRRTSITKSVNKPSPIRKILSTSSRTPTIVKIPSPKNVKASPKLKMILDSPVIPSPKPSLDDSGVVLDMMMIDDSVKKEPQIRIANVTGVDDYLDDIYYHWKSLETTVRIDPNYMINHPELDFSMRQELFSWIIQLHSFYSLSPETVFQTFTMIDRFLSVKNKISAKKIELLGIVCLFIACKFVESGPIPNIKDMQVATNGKFTRDEILKAERFILNRLAFVITCANPLDYLDRYVGLCKGFLGGDFLAERYLVTYFLEASAVDGRFLIFGCSELVAACMVLALDILIKRLDMHQHMSVFGYEFSHLEPISLAVLGIMNDPVAHHHVVYEKFKDMEKYSSVSLYVEQFIAQMKI